VTKAIDTGPWGRAAGFIEPLAISEAAWNLVVAPVDRREEGRHGLWAVLVMARRAYSRLTTAVDSVAFPAHVATAETHGRTGQPSRLILHRIHHGDGAVLIIATSDEPAPTDLGERPPDSLCPGAHQAPPPSQ
jgi:hypothetical protein